MKTLRALCLLLLAAGAVQAVPAADPVLSISPGPFVFDVPYNGSNPPSGTLIITNTGSGKMDWLAVEETPVPWMSLVPPVPAPLLSRNASAQVAIVIDVTGLAPGPYTTRIKVSSTAATNGPLFANVVLNVNEAPRITATPDKFTFSGPNPGGQTLKITNSGGDTLNWTATLSDSWLKLNIKEGALGSGGFVNLFLSVDVTGLAENTYNGKVTINAPGASNTPVDVPVTLTVTFLPVIDVQPATVTFDTPLGASPGTKDIVVKNVGGGTLKWIVEDDGSWLTLSPLKGSLGGGSPAPVTLTVNSTLLAEGVYTAKITVRDEFDASIATKQVDVTLNVNGSPKIGLNPESLSFTVPVDSGGSSPKAVSVTNTGSDVLNWKLVGGATWLMKSKDKGALNPLESDPILLSVNPTGLTPNVYTTTVQIEDPAASNSPKLLIIQMTVTPSSLPTSAPAGQCGLLGLEMVAALLLIRTLKSRGGSR